MTIPRLFLLPLVAIAAVVAASPLAAATLYKWVDDKGVVHYTDKMPADAVDKGNVELNKQGITVKRTEPAPSPEQRRAKQLEEERLRATSREREVVDRRDRALLQSYTTEDEIDLARKRALGTLDTQVQSAQAYSVQLTKRRAELEAKRNAYGTKPVPAAVDTELESIGSELAKQEALIAERKRDGAVITSKYDQDKQRWRELRSMGEAREAAAAAAEAAKAAPGSRSGAAATAQSGASANSGASRTR